MMPQQGQNQESYDPSYPQHSVSVPSGGAAAAARPTNPRSRSRPFLACTHCHSARTACAEQRPCPRCTRYGYQCTPRTRAKYGSFGATSASSSAESVVQQPEQPSYSTPRFIPPTPAVPSSSSSASMPFIPREGMNPDWLQQWQRQLQSEMEMINAIQRRLDPSSASPAPLPPQQQQQQTPMNNNPESYPMTPQMASQGHSFRGVDPRYEYANRLGLDTQFQNSMSNRQASINDYASVANTQQIQQPRGEYQQSTASSQQWQPSYQPQPPNSGAQFTVPSYLAPDDGARNMSAQFPTLIENFDAHQHQSHDGHDALGALYPLANDPLAQLPPVPQDPDLSISDRTLLTSNQQFSPMEGLNSEWPQLQTSFPEAHNEFHIREQPEYMAGTDDTTSSSSFRTPFSPNSPAPEQSFGSHLQVPATDSNRDRSASQSHACIDSDLQPYSHDVVAFAAEQLYQVDAALADGTMTLSRARMIISSIFFPLWSEVEQEQLLQMFDALKKSRRPSHSSGATARESAMSAATAAATVRLQAGQQVADDDEIATSRKKRRLQPDGSNSLPDSGSEISSSATSVRHLIKSHPVSDNAVRELIQLWRKQYCPAPAADHPDPNHVCPSPSPEPSPASLMLAALSFSFSPLTAYTDDADDIPRMRISHLGVQWVNIDTIVNSGSSLPPAVAVAMPPVRSSCIGGTAPIMLATAPRSRHRPKSRRYRTKEEEEAEWLTDQERYLQQQLQKLALVSTDARKTGNASSTSSSSSSTASQFSTLPSMPSGATSALVECLTLQVNAAWERETGWSQAEQRAACLKYGRLGYWRLNMRPDYIEAGAREFWSYQLQAANALDNPRLNNSIEDGEDDSDNASTYSSSSSSTLHPKIPPLDMIVVMIHKDGTERLRHLIWQPSNIIIDGSFQSTVHIIQPLTNREKDELVIPKYGDVITHEDIIYGRKRGGRGVRMGRPF